MIWFHVRRGLSFLVFISEPYVYTYNVVGSTSVETTKTITTRQRSLLYMTGSVSYPNSTRRQSKDPTGLKK